MFKEKFCEWQLYAKGDSEKAFSCHPNDPKAELFCGAHLNESRAFPCPYTSDEIYPDNSRQPPKRRIAHKDNQGNLTGVCEDFKLPETRAQS